MARGCESGYLEGFLTNAERYFGYPTTRVSAISDGILGRDYGAACTRDPGGGCDRLDLPQ